MADVIVTGTVLECRYTEPTTKADGSPLDDLAATRIYSQIGAAAPILEKTVPATSPSGGGAIVTTITIPSAAGQEVNVSVWFTAVDEVPNESAPSPVFVRQIDRLAPSPPF